MRVLLTNDDGIQAEGLQALRRALQLVEGIELVVVAPDGNRSAMARSITTRRPLWVEKREFPDGTHGYATDGTPVDCVRLASLGLVEGFKPDLVMSGINHGVNLGDDISYSGTVAAALEGVLLGLPAIAVSQQINPDNDYDHSGEADFDRAARFAVSLLGKLQTVIPLRLGTLLNVNVPAGKICNVEVAPLGRRVYQDELQSAGHHKNGRPQFWIYGADNGAKREPETDLALLASGNITITPLHFELTDHDGLSLLDSIDFQQFLQAI